MVVRWFSNYRPLGLPNVQTLKINRLTQGQNDDDHEITLENPFTSPWKSPFLVPKRLSVTRSPFSVLLRTTASAQRGPRRAAAPAVQVVDRTAAAHAAELAHQRHVVAPHAVHQRGPAVTQRVNAGWKFAKIEGKMYTNDGRTMNNDEKRRLRIVGDKSWDMVRMRK